ncbi:hypothetical protein BofuT4_uP110480.1 [Botrytis cinerea T4]|uniref:Uncharacterized protein n=1 Tax=Botryotinia fuckeliana (strain T4) TaxID=999810 RepID=G2Y5Y3_BOTF4|nr:hypothetical protein BofuT4_uP110480.1 [Botrytis cinerea T4]
MPFGTVSIVALSSLAMIGLCIAAFAVWRQIKKKRESEIAEVQRTREQTFF